MVSFVSIFLTVGIVSLSCNVIVHGLKDVKSSEFGDRIANHLNSASSSMDSAVTKRPTANIKHLDLIPGVILPKCPCENENDLCRDYEYCYCHMGYPSPRSFVTGEPFLKSYLEQCARGSTNKSSNPSLGSLSALDRSQALFPFLNWDCQDHLYLHSPRNFYPYLCVESKRLPVVGSFYEVQTSRIHELQRSFLRNSLQNRIKRKYSWKDQSNYHAHSSSKTALESRHAPRIQFSQRIEMDNGDSFVISGGRGCFHRLGVYRQRTFFYYKCNIYFSLNSSSTAETTCSTIRLLLETAKRHLLNVQLDNIFNVTTDGNITYAAPLEKNDGLEPIVTQQTTFANPKPTNRNAEEKVCTQALNGLHFKFVHFRHQLIAAEFTEKEVTQQRSAPLVFSIEIRSESSDVDPKYVSKLSRFWYTFYYSPCENDICWKDMFRFSLREDLYSDYVTTIVAISIIPLLGTVITYAHYRGRF